MNRELFKNPPNKYRPMPFWFLNSVLTKDEIKWQVREMGKKGVGGFFLHARNGLETGYLSEEWFDCLEVAVKEGQKLRMQVWLYDEYPYPSGIGGFKVTEVYDYRHKFIDLIEKKISGPQKVSMTIGKGEVLLVLAFNNQSFPWDVISVKQHVDGEILSCDIPKGDWLVAVFVKRVYDDRKGYIFAPDFLNKKAMEYYFSNVHELYKKRLGRFFGKTIRGIFTDEPSIMAWHQTNPWSYRCHHNQRIAAWSDSVEESLKEQYGYRNEDTLPSVFFDWHRKSGEIREKYWTTIGKLYVDSFLNPYKNWCEENKLLLTGHLFQEEGLYSNLIFGGDYFDSLGCLHIPGVDHLLLNCERRDGGLEHIFPNSTNIQGQKLVSSIAHINGKDTVLSETYGVTGWGLSLKDMKWIADWQYTLGINFMCPHSFYYSLEGYRKGDFPPSHFFQATFWKHYKKYTDYIGRLSYMLRGGIHQAKIALVHPSTSFKTEFKPGAIDTRDRKISDYYDLYSSLLIKLHRDYDIIPDKSITPESVKNGELNTACEKYKILIIPYITTIEEIMLSALEKLISTGGTVIFSELFSSDLPGGAGNKYRERLTKLLISKGCYSLRSFRDVKKRLKAVLDAASPPFVEIDNSDIGYIYKRKRGIHIYYFANYDPDKSHDVRIKINNIGVVERWDLKTGKIGRADIVDYDEQSVTIQEYFAECGSLLLTIRPGELNVSNERKRIAEKHEHKIIDLGGEWKFHIESPNVLILDEWHFWIDQFDTYLNYHYVTTVDIQYAPWNISLLLDDIESRHSLLEEMKLTIKINGHAVSGRFGHFIDKKFKVLDITRALKKGKNTIDLIFYNVGWGGVPKNLTSHPKLLGNFELSKGAKLIKPEDNLKLGDWSKQGYPYFSGAGIYSKNVKIQKKLNRRYLLNLGAVNDIAEIIINGHTGKVITWPPYETDVTDRLKNGLNKISIKVINSLLNFMDGIPRNNLRKGSGLLSKVRIIET